MKILYLICLYNGEINGGHTYRMATAEALKRIVGYDNLDLVVSDLDNSDWKCNIALRLPHYSSSISKLKNLLGGNITQRSNKDIEKIIDLINSNNYDLVIFGSSETGKLIKLVKEKCHIKTITWYHDIVADVITRKMSNSKNLFKYLVWKSEMKAECIDAKYTDIPIVLHQRDADLLKKYWGRDTDAFVPICLQDKCTNFDDYKNKQSLNKEPLQLLFIGAYTWDVNVKAVLWFCEFVMSKLVNKEVIFNIAGFEMENLRSNELLSSMKNINIIGTVDNLEEVYKNADIVVEPIIEGSGMKVKTAEALMFGKEIIGTEEALVGYDELKDCTCNTAEEFIQRIEYYINNRPLRFSKKNRSYYEKYFSIDGLTVKLEEILKEI